MLCIATLCLLGLTQPLTGQQSSQSSMYFQNKYKYNPAYAGFDGSLSITGGYRTQWLGLARNPVTQDINGHMPLYLLNGAVGFQIENDILGALGQFRASLSYSYVQESFLGLWGAGLRVGFQQISLDGTQIITPEGVYEDGLINHNDPILPEVKVSGASPFASIGGYFIHDLFEIGLAVDNLIAPNVKMDGIGASWDFKPVFNFYGEFLYDFSGVLSFHPSIFLKTDLVQTQIDVSLQAIYNEYLYGGLAWRGYNSKTFDAIILFGGIQLNANWKIGYAFDIPISALNVNSRGSHEVILNYNLDKVIGLGLPPKTIYNPRF